jgi:hypothetical protein
MSFILPDYQWKLVYYDGTEFTNEDGEPWESPEIGLVLVLQPGLDYDVLRDVNHYLYDTELGRWINCDDRGIWDRLTREIRRYSCYRSGWNVPVRAEFEKIREKYMLEIRGR